MISARREKAAGAAVLEHREPAWLQHATGNPPRLPDARPGQYCRKRYMESQQNYDRKPVRPVAPYIGGKRNLARRIVPIIDADGHDIYAEPFVGMGGVFLRRSRARKAEVINDVSADVAGFFRILQRHYVPFMEMLRWQITTREAFERLIKVDPDTLTDLERAARFLYLQRTAFGGKVASRTFGVSPARPGRFDVTKLGSMLEDVHSRLAGVVIERLPFERFIKTYDRPETLFYLDPPYYGCEDDYGKAVFSREDFQLIGALLKRLKGRFIVSLNDRSEVREIFADFPMREVPTTYTVGSKNSKAVGELIIASSPELTGG